MQVLNHKGFTGNFSSIDETAFTSFEKRVLYNMAKTIQSN
jgi:hypothetical protein